MAAAMTVDTRELPCSTDGCSMPSCCWIASSAVLSSTCRRDKGANNQIYT